MVYVRLCLTPIFQSHGAYSLKKPTTKSHNNLKLIGGFPSPKHIKRGLKNYSNYVDKKEEKAY